MSKCENCILREFNSLRVLSKQDLKSISDSKVIKKIKKGDIIFEEGERLNGVFCVKDGISKLSKLSANGRDQIVKITSKGQIMGQRSIIAEEKTNLSAVALNDMEMCFIPRQIIVEKINNNPEYTKALLTLMARELKEADDLIVNMSQKNVKQRMADALLYLERNFGVDKDGYLSISLTREDIANVVGTATESGIRILSEFKRKDYISTARKRIKIKNPTALNMLSSRA